VSSFLSIVSNAPGDTPLVMAGDTADLTPPWQLVAVHDLGNPKWTHQTSGPRGTQGRRVVAGTPEDRVQSWGLVSQWNADKDELDVSLSALNVKVDQMRKYGGTIVSRELNQTRKQRWDVMVASMEITKWEANEFQLRDAVRPLITATVAPYSRWDPYDFSDYFTTDDVNGGEAFYEADAGALTNVDVTDGTLAGAANLATENRLIFVGSGYTFGDIEVEAKLTPGSTITSLKGGVILKRIDDENYIEAYVDDNGTNSRVRIDKVVATVRTNLATANLGSRMTAGRRIGIRGRIEGNLVVAGMFGSFMTFHAFATTEVTATLSTADAALFGGDVGGEWGLVFTPQHASASISDLKSRPFTYRAFDQGPIRLRGLVRGDAPAACDLWASSPGGGSSYQFGMLAWAPHKPFNRLQNGGFDGLLGSLGEPWQVSAVSGITGAATSVALSAAGAARFGNFSGLVTTPATANVGASYPMYQRFYKGVTYTFDIYVRSDAATHNVRLRFGVSGDVASSTAAALSTTWTKRTVTWTPTASVRLAYICVEQTAATAGNFNIDGACVYEGTVAPTHQRHAQGVGGFPPLAQIAAADYVSKSANWSIVSDADAVADYFLQDASVSAAGEGYQWIGVVDPSLVGQDDYSDGFMAFEVWAILKVSDAFTGGITASLYAIPPDGGTAITAPDRFLDTDALVFGDEVCALYRLGRLNLGAVDQLPWYLVLGFAVAAGTNLEAFGMDSVYLVPSRAVARTPTGKSSTGYPAFFPSAGGQTKIIRSPDLAGIGGGFFAGEDILSGAAAGMHGKPIELPPGDVDAMFLLNKDIPGGNQGNTSETAFAGSAVHFAITPRSAYLRGTA